MEGIEAVFILPAAALGAWGGSWFAPMVDVPGAVGLVVGGVIAALLAGYGLMKLSGDL